MTQNEEHEMQNGMDKMADAILAPFPDGITDEQIIWQVNKRGLAEEVVKHIPDHLLWESLWNRNHDSWECRKEIQRLLQQIAEQQQSCQS